jgi:arabinose-5-phosphate isomerase
MIFRPGEKLPIADIAQTIGQMCKELKDVARRGAVMIVDKKGKLAGIITDADLRRAMADKGADVFKCQTNEIMTPDCKRVTESTLAAEAMALFHEYRIDELPVVDEKDRPVGMIDVQDIVAIKIVD